MLKCEKKTYKNIEKRPKNAHKCAKIVFKTKKGAQLKKTADTDCSVCNFFISAHGALGAQLYGE